MDDGFIKIIRFFFKENFSQKRMFVILMSIMTAIISFFFFYRQEWIRELKNDYGALVIPLLLALVFVVTFLVLELICNAVYSRIQEKKRRRREIELIIKKIEYRYNTLSRLSDWQINFLIDMVMQKKMQIQAYEIGGYHAVWGPEMEVLIMKKIVRKITFNSYEINPEYFDYLEKYYDPETGELSLPDIVSYGKEENYQKSE